MRSFTESFFKLHQAPTPFLLVNVHDPLSVLLAQSQGAVAIGTSSAALAWSLGYADGEQLPVAALLDAVKRLLRVSQLPLTIDLESGYSSNPDDVADLVLQLAQSGVAGINLEDGVAPPELLCQKIIACRAKLAGYPLFINARTDVFLQQLAATDALSIAMCQQRLQAYQTAGADGGFIPGLSSLAIVEKISKDVTLPINLMGWPEQATSDELNQAQVKRISAGPMLLLTAANALRCGIADYLQQAAPQGMLDYTTMQQLCR